MIPPNRVKVQGDLFHGRVPDGAIYVGRATPGLKQSPYRNPYSLKDHTLADSLRLFGEHIAPKAAEIRAELEGRDLACWCPLDQDCHADILLRLANITTTEGDSWK